MGGLGTYAKPFCGGLGEGWCCIGTRFELVLRMVFREPGRESNPG